MATVSSLARTLALVEPQAATSSEAFAVAEGMVTILPWKKPTAAEIVGH
jgi:hypothetical protein